LASLIDGVFFKFSPPFPPPLGFTSKDQPLAFRTSPEVIIRCRISFPIYKRNDLPAYFTKSAKGVDYFSFLTFPFHFSPYHPHFIPWFRETRLPLFPQACFKKAGRRARLPLLEHSASPSRVIFIFFGCPPLSTNSGLWPKSLEICSPAHGTPTFPPSN